MDFNTTSTYYNWEERPPYVTPDGRTVHFLYTLGAMGERYEGGQVHAFKTDVSPADAEHGPGPAECIGKLSWNHATVQYLGVEEEWQRQGVATEMWKLARIEEPRLGPGDRQSDSGGRQLVEHLKRNGLM